MSNIETNDLFYNLNIERALLSAVLFDGEVFEEIAFRVIPADFYFPFHQKVFEAMGELNRNNKPIDENFLLSILSRTKDYDEVAMVDIIASTPLSSTSAYIDMLIEFSKKRSLKTLSFSIRKSLEEEGESSSNAYSLITKALDLLDGKEPVTSLTRVEVIGSLRKQMEDAKRGVNPYFCKTGLYNLDRFMGGWKGKRLIILAARPSVGKTALLVTLADFLLSENISIRIDSLEMSSEEMMQRFVAKRTGDDLLKMSLGEIANMDTIYRVLSDFENEPMSIDDESYLTMDNLIAKAKRDYRKNPFKVWFIDHLRYVKLTGKSTADRAIEIGTNMKMLKNFAKEFNIDIVALSQINREVQNRAGNRPNMGDLRDSGSIEEDADVIIFPHREAYNNAKSSGTEEGACTEVEIIVDKNRNGPTGIAKCFFEKRSARFTNEHAIEYVYEDEFEENTRVTMPSLGL